jgi:hypothetical protein
MKLVRIAANRERFEWAVFRARGIWEAHVIGRNANGGAHHEWVRDSAWDYIFTLAVRPLLRPRGQDSASSHLLSAIWDFAQGKIRIVPEIQRRLL